MSVDEARQQKAMALLQYEEAKEELERLHEQAKSLTTMLHTVVRFAEDLRSSAARVNQSAWSVQGAQDVVGNPDDFRKAMDYDDLIRLHDRIIAADKRLHEAQRVKQTLGLK